MPNPFDTSAMAAGYASARPPVHPRVMEMAQPAFAQMGPIARALDVGCGAGLSTRALTPYAGQVFGLEPAAGMLQWRSSIAPAAHFVAGAAETLPFAAAQFDLIAAAGSLNFVALERFLPEALRVLRPGGQLLVYDYSHGRRFRADGSLDAWFTEFLNRYPAPPSQARPLNPAILREIDPRWALGDHHEFEVGISLARDFYIEYLLTSTNVAAAVRRGARPEEIRDWCQQTLAPFWRDGEREVLFRGYWAFLRPVND